MALDEVTAARYIPMLQGEVRRQKTRIEDLERALRLLRQHTAGCERCAAVQEEDAAKRLADL